MENLRRIKVIDLLKRTDFGTNVNVKGWVRTRRGNKQINFIALNDGSTIKNIQVVVDITKFDEEMLNIDTITPNIKCNTGEIFKVFREKFYKQISKEEADKLLKMKSVEVLNNLNIKEANDLYEPAISVYPKLEEYTQNNWYFSGSGSSFFKVNNGK